MEGKTLIAIVGSLEDAAWGNNFITENELPMQIGIMRKNKVNTDNHVHKMRDRKIKSISNEFHFIVRGKARVSLFGLKKKLITKIMLCPNMFCALFNGGHGYELVKDDTLMIEVKNGEFSEDLTLDKEKIK